MVCNFKICTWYQAEKEPNLLVTDEELLKMT